MCIFTQLPQVFSNAMKAKLFLFLENFIYFIKIKAQQFFKKLKIQLADRKITEKNFTSDW